jgi:hypothetical protein
MDSKNPLKKKLLEIETIGKNLDINDEESF